MQSICVKTPRKKKYQNDTYFDNIWHHKVDTIISKYKLFTIIYHYINCKLSY